MGGYDPSKNVFEVTDCRGISISCSEENWFGKILGIRPYMIDWLPLIIQAIEKPHFICTDSKKKDRNVYYMFHRYQSDRYLKIVVRYTTNGKGYMISAFPTDGGKDGEKMIWPESSN